MIELAFSLLAVSASLSTVILTRETSPKRGKIAPRPFVFGLPVRVQDARRAARKSLSK